MLKYTADEPLDTARLAERLGAIECIKRPTRDCYEKIAIIPAPASARTFLFVPELGRFCLAIPHRANQSAEIRIYKTKQPGK